MKTQLELLQEHINGLTVGEKIQLHNEYCQSINNCDNEIYENDDEFFEIFFTKPLEAIRATHFGDYNYSHDYVMFNGYGNLDSFNGHSVDEFISVVDIAQRILEVPSDFNSIQLDDVIEQDETEEA